MLPHAVLIEHGLYKLGPVAIHDSYSQTLLPLSYSVPGAYVLGLRSRLVSLPPRPPFFPRLSPANCGYRAILCSSLQRQRPSRGFPEFLCSLVGATDV